MNKVNIELSELEIAIIIGVLGRNNDSDTLEDMKNECFVKENHVKMYYRNMNKINKSNNYKLFSKLVDIYQSL